MHPSDKVRQSFFRFCGVGFVITGVILLLMPFVCFWLISPELTLQQFLWEDTARAIILPSFSLFFIWLGITTYNKGKD